MTVVRRATTEDAEAIRKLARESWHAAYDAFLGCEAVDATVDDWYGIDGLEASIADATDRSDATFLVASATDASDREPGGGSESETETERDEIDLVGFIHIVPSSKADESTVASLRRLYVRPDDWGTGIGSTLLERAVETLANGYDRLRLEVFAENEVGVSFYDSAGFERVDEHEAAFADDLQTVYIYERLLESK